MATDSDVAVTYRGLAAILSSVANHTKIADSAAVANNQQQFSNPAYVLMQFFGYLRRNPDDVPDGNLNGYNFWLNELNSGTKTTFDMVDAFTSSIEYRARFFNSPFCN